MTVNLTALAESRAKMTTGEFEVWTSNSFRRITAHQGPDGCVLRGEIQRHDGHPDLGGCNRDADLSGLVATHNAADVLIEVARTALEWQSESEDHLADGTGPISDTGQSVRRLRAALAKVTL